ncbi:MAG: hypothetical protein GYA39_04570 [Methanothrix sp.]|nr:hypothetical protein [Methanothrix sp.]
MDDHACHGGEGGAAMSEFFALSEGRRIRVSDDGVIAVFEDDDGSVPLRKRNKAVEGVAELFFGKETYKVSPKQLKAALREFPDDNVIEVSALMHEIGLDIIAPLFRFESSAQDKVVLVAGFGDRKESDEEARE